EDFEDYWNGLTQRISAVDFQDLAMASDGVFSFKPFSHDSFRPVTEDELLTFLLVDRDEGPIENTYRRKLMYVSSNFGLKASDDLTVVRLSY
ncbi:MAG: hypothetical protein AB8H12_12285, partial [Lewinella sp.]